MKWFLRLFTSLCLIFLGAYGYLHAGVYQHGMRHIPMVSLPTKALVTSLGSNQNVEAIRARGASSHRVKIRGILDDNDDDEDDEPSVSIAKYFTASTGLPAFSYVRPTGCFSSCISQCSPFREHYCYTSSSRYRLFRVFRI
jgi:hypothetical protein